MELVIANDLTALEEIKFNFEELFKKLTDKLSTYQGLVYDEAQIKEAKEDRASLNKLKIEMENKRKEIKKILNVPYADFEVKVKELVALVQQPIDEIDKQVKLAEDKAKLVKRQLINDFYEENGDDRLKLSRIFDEKWLNSSLKMNKVTDEIMGLVGFFRRDLEIIEGMKSIFNDKLVAYYIDTQDLGYVMAEKTKLDDASKVIVEEVKKEEARQPVTPLVPEPAKPATDGTVIFTLKFITDKEKMNLLNDFIVFNQINYERIL